MTVFHADIKEVHTIIHSNLVKCLNYINTPINVSYIV